MAKESKYADKLRELGFEKEPSMLPRHLRRKSRAMHQQGLLKPTFSPYETFTLVTDETGQLWRAEGKLDLSFLGFRNNVDWFEGTGEGKKPN